jgi:hypothetical protein
VVCLSQKMAVKVQKNPVLPEKKLPLAKEGKMLTILRCSRCGKVLSINYDGLTCPDCNGVILPYVLIENEENEEKTEKPITYAS